MGSFRITTKCIVILAAAVLCSVPSAFGFATTSSANNKVEVCSEAGNRQCSCVLFAYSSTRSELLQSSRSLSHQEQHDHRLVLKFTEALATRRSALAETTRKLKTLIIAYATMTLTLYRQNRQLIQNFMDGATTMTTNFIQAPNSILFQQYVLANNQYSYSPPLESKVVVEEQQQYASSKKEDRLQAKYAAIESLEERAFQICKDLGMI